MDTDNLPAYDAVVVGGGPAGSTAAYLLAGFGYRVTLLERERYPRDKVCAGCLSQKSIRFLDRVFDLPVPALREEGLLDSAGIDYALYVGSNRVLAGDLTEPFYFTRRERYDACLARRAADAGVEVREGVEVTAVDHADRTVTTSDGDRYTGRVIIGADGIHSGVRRSLPESVFEHDRWRENLGWAMELAIPRKEAQALRNGDGAIRLDAELATPHLVLDACRWGYGWVFPNREAIVVGLGGLLQKNRKALPERFREFLNDIGLAAFADRKPAAYPLPFGNYIPSPAHEGTVLVGDAGGFASPILGEGIFYAHRTAELAAYAVDRHLTSGAPLGETYTALLNRRLIPELRAEKTLRNFLYNCLDAGIHLPLEAMMRATNGRVIDAIQGHRSFRGFQRDDELHSAVW
ncbi:MAG: NAD(P)/FAD-dependent oxidoreductase [Methanomicrobiales archaeon]|nr:NAD(P)/FAD-dependent oxidoreductase [Methanomicrobiales archaeon]